MRGVNEAWRGQTDRTEVLQKAPNERRPWAMLDSNSRRGPDSEGNNLQQPSNNNLEIWQIALYTGILQHLARALALNARKTPRYRWGPQRQSTLPGMRRPTFCSLATSCCMTSAFTLRSTNGARMVLSRPMRLA